MPTGIAVTIYLIPVVGLLYTSSDSILARNTSLEERNRGIGIAAAAVFIGQCIGSVISSGIMALIGGSRSVEVQYLWSFRLMIPLLAIATVCGWKLTQMMAEDEESEILDAVLED